MRKIRSSTTNPSSAEPQVNARLWAERGSELLDDTSKHALDEAVRLLRLAVDHTSIGEVELPRRMLNLANALDTRYARDSAPGDLDEVITLSRDAAALATRDLDLLGACLTAFCHGILGRHERNMSNEDLDEAVRAGRTATSLTDTAHAYRASRFSQAAHALRLKFESRHELEDLVEAVGYYRVAATTPPAAGENPSVYLRNYALASRTLFDITGSDHDLDETIKAICGLAGSQTVVADYSQIGKLLDMRFERHSQVKDLDAAILALRRGLELEPTTSDRLSLTTDLAITLRKRFKASGDVRYLGQAEEHARLALGVAPPADKLSCLNGLGNILLNRFEHSGDITVLSDAVALFRRAAAVPPDSTDPGILTNLSNALQRRYSHARQFEDLTEAIAVSRQALDSAPPGHPDHVAVASTLADALSTRYDRFGRADDIDDAIASLHAALDSAAPGTFIHRLVTANIGILLYHRYLWLRDRSDLEESIRLARDALGKASKPGPEHARHMINLGNSLYELFKLDHRSGHLDEAIELAQAASRINADIERGLFLFRTGEMCRERFQYAGSPGDAESAIENFHAAADTIGASLLLRVTAARKWGEQAALISDDDQAVQGYVTATELLPSLSWRGASRRTRESLLAAVQGTASEAAACAITTARYDLAVSLLELGRSVLWSQQIELQTDLADVAAVDEELANRLAQARGRLLDEFDEFTLRSSD